MTGTTPRAATCVGWLSVAVWRAGAGLYRQPRCERQYVVVPPDHRGTLWRVWLAGHAGRGGFVDGHTSVALPAATAEGTEEAERADVLRPTAPAAPAEAASPADAVAVVDRTLDRYPGCLVALAPTAGGGCVAAARDGTRVAATPVAGPGRPAMTGAERAGLASFLHAQLVLGLPWAPRGAFHALRCGGAGSPQRWLRLTCLTPRG